MATVNVGGEQNVDRIIKRWREQFDNVIELATGENAWFSINVIDVDAALDDITQRIMSRR